MPQDHNDEQDMRVFSIEDENGLEDELLDIDDAGIADQPSFEEALEAIQAETLEPTALLGFSDVSRNDARRLATAWKTLPDETRETIADHVTALADEDILLDFLRFFRVLLDDPSVAVRQSAVSGLASREDESLIQPLSDVATSDPDEGVRLAAIEALSSFTTMAEFDIIEPKVVKPVFRLLFKLVGDERQPDSLRAAALVSAAVQGDEQVRKAIAAFHRSGEPDLRVGALQAMGRSGADRWFMMLESAIRSRDVDERLAAAGSLANYDEAAVPLLTMLVREDTEAPVRQEAIQSLGTIGGRKALESLRELSKHASVDEQEAIADAMIEAEAFVALEEGDQGDELEDDDLF